MGLEVLYPPGQGSGICRRQARSKPHRRLENGSWSPRAQPRRLGDPPTSAVPTAFPLIGACAQTLIGQFPRSLGLRKASRDSCLGPAHTTPEAHSLSFPIPTSEGLGHTTILLLCCCCFLSLASLTSSQALEGCRQYKTKLSPMELL